jgi:hypothetical protein
VLAEGWDWASEGGVLTHLPLPWVAERRPTGARAAASSQEGCLGLLEPCSCSLLAPTGGWRGSGLSDHGFPLVLW